MLNFFLNTFGAKSKVKSFVFVIKIQWFRFPLVDKVTMQFGCPGKHMNEIIFSSTSSTGYGFNSKGPI